MITLHFKNEKSVKSKIFFFLLGLIHFQYIASQDTIDTLIGKGKKYFQEKNGEKALLYYKKVLELDPHNPHALYMIANIFYYNAQHEESIKYNQEFLKFYPNHPDVMLNLGMSLACAGKFDEAQKTFEALEQFEETKDRAQYYLWVIYLRNRDWKNAGRIQNLKSHWWYDQDINRKKILIQFGPHHGLGDTICYLRYAKRLHNAGALVTVQVRDELVPLLSLCPYVEQVISNNDSIPHVDIIYDGSPVIMMQKEFEQEMKKDVPYIFAAPHLIKYWRTQFEHDTNLKVGLCWQSTPMRDFFSNNLITGPRGMHLHRLIPLADIQHVSFYSLQKFIADDQIYQQPKTFIVHEINNGNFDQENGRFMDTAAIIKNLDLVITVDTSIAHLAGALGVPVWLMLPFASDYRWLRDRSDSIWYPTMRLFRQSELGNWDTVIYKVKAELNKLAQEHMLQN